MYSVFEVSQHETKLHHCVFCSEDWVLNLIFTMKSCFLNAWSEEVLHDTHRFSEQAPILTEVLSTRHFLSSKAGIFHQFPVPEKRWLAPQILLFGNNPRRPSQPSLQGQEVSHFPWNSRKHRRPRKARLFCRNLPPGPGLDPSPRRQGCTRPGGRLQDRGRVSSPPAVG